MARPVDNNDALTSRQRAVTQIARWQYLPDQLARQHRVGGGGDDSHVDRDGYDCRIGTGMDVTRAF